MATLITLIAIAVAIPSAVNATFGLYDRYLAWQQGKALPPPSAAIRRPWAVWLFNLIGIAALGLAAWNIWTPSRTISATGFNKEWPDALKCKAGLVMSANSADYSPLIFYFNGIRNSQTMGSKVYGYFLAGGYNFPNVGYLVHELWFRDDGVLVRPKDFGIMEPEFYSFDQLRKLQIVRERFPNDQGAQQYILGFNNADCGGNTMSEIRTRGNAFMFAGPERRTD